LRPFTNGPEQRCGEHLEDRRRNRHVLWEGGKEGEKFENAISMWALVVLKGLSNEPIFEADVQIPKFALPENLTVVLSEHVHEVPVDYTAGYAQKAACNIEHQRQPAARRSRVMLDLIEGWGDLLATNCVDQRDGIVGWE